MSYQMDYAPHAKMNCLPKLVWMKPTWGIMVNVMID
jgi:hypothetical protein